MCSKVLNGHIILTDTSITTILAPEMTYTPNYFGFQKKWLHLRSVYEHSRLKSCEEAENLRVYDAEYL